jgi:protein-tyrosine phosphatase
MNVGPAEHLIRLNGVLNLRELGGYPTADGRQTRIKRLLRSDDLDRLAPEAQKFLIEYGVRTVIDLRDPSEAEDAPDVFAVSAQATYVLRPFFDDEGLQAGPASLEVSKGARYLRQLELYAHNVAEIFRAIVQAEGGVTLFHCAAGKDRTGLVAALLLALAGVPDAVIDADYAVSFELLAERIADLRAEAIRQGQDMQLFEQRAACLPASMQEVLDGLRARYGGAEGYLRQVGVSQTEIAALRARLMD